MFGSDFSDGTHTHSMNHEKNIIWAYWLCDFEKVTCLIWVSFFLSIDRENNPIFIGGCEDYIKHIVAAL